MPPYRTRATAYLDRPCSILRAIRRRVAQLGGPSEAVRRAIGLYRSNGWKGLGRGFSAIKAIATREAADGRNDYAKWVALYGTCSDSHRSKLYDYVRRLKARPRVSVIMPVYNPRPRWLEEAIESVRKQIYPDWQLCIADDASTDPAIRPLLLRYAAMDPRIKIEFRGTNGHISAASNTALKLADGEWIVLFDHDDLLAEDALFWVVHSIERHPDAKLIYSDEDKVTAGGTRCVPHFKPDWNYDLFLSYNVICHLGAYRRDLVNAVGGFRAGFEGAQDYDLALRCVERLAPWQIVHVPRILYHWRMHAGSTAVGGQVKPYAFPAGTRALNEHFSRRGISASAELQSAGYHCVRYALPTPHPLVSVIVVGDSSGGPILPWLEDLLARTHYESYELWIVVDALCGNEQTEASQPTKGLVEWLASRRNVRASLIAEAACNINGLIDRAVSRSTGELIAVIEAGLQPQSDNWLSELVSFAAQPGVGAVAPRVVDAEGNCARAGVIFGIGAGIGWAHRGRRSGDTGYFHRAVVAQTVAAVTPGCLVMQKSLYLGAGGLTGTSIAPELADLDLCLRLRGEGSRNAYVGHVVLCEQLCFRHAAPPTVDLSDALADATSEVRDRWRTVLDSDPAYNPNLTIEYEDFSLAWPPRLADSLQ